MRPVDRINLSSVWHLPSSEFGGRNGTHIKMRTRTLSLDFHHFRLTAQDLVGISRKSVAGTCEARGIASHAASAAFFAFSMCGVTSASRKTSAAVAGLAIFGSRAGSLFLPPFLRKTNKCGQIMILSEIKKFPNARGLPR